MTRGPDRFTFGRRGVLLALVSAACSASAFANVGKVDFAAGGVTVTNAEGRVQQLVKGAEVRSGDKIVSATDGRAQIRFSDGAYVSLQPNTEFDIKEYRYDGKTDGTESAVFSLFKGALRTVTGLVGRVNRNKYQITTPTATIGIRGTGGLVQIGANGSTLVTGTSGIWTLSTNGGTLQIPAGTAGFAGSPNLPPRQTTEGPIVPPTQPQEQPPAFVQGDTRSAQGTPVSLFGPPLPSGPGYGVALGANLSQSNNGITVQAPATAVFDSNGPLTRITYATTGPFDFLLAGAQAEYGAADGIIAWGRWTGDVIRNGVLVGTFGENQGFYYVVGTPTPFANLPASGTFTYNLIGATQPTFSNGLTAPGTLTAAQLTGDFLAKTVNVQLTAAAGGLQFNGSATGLPITSLNGSAIFSGNNPTGVTGSGCPTGCQLDVSGFFAGNGATHAGLSYDIGGSTGTAQGSNLVGGAALKR